MWRCNSTFGKAGFFPQCWFKLPRGEIFAHLFHIGDDLSLSDEILAPGDEGFIKKKKKK